MTKNQRTPIWLIRFHNRIIARFKRIRNALAKATPMVTACDDIYTRHSHTFSDPGQDYINLQSDRARIHRDREAFRVDMKSLSRDLRRWFIQHDAIMARTNARHTSKNHPSQLPPCE